MQNLINRRQLIKGITAGTILSQLGSLPALASNERRLFVDGLCFLPDDLADLSSSKIDAYLCDISAIEAIKQPDGTTNYKRTYKACIKSIAEANSRVEANKDKLILGLNSSDIKRAKQTDRTAVFFQIQGADCVEESIDNNLNQVDEFHAKGLRALQLTHHYGNQFSGGALDNDASGGLNLPLTKAGEALIHKLNQSNILVDVSHSSPQAALDTARTSNSPIVQSHGAVRAIVNHARCSPDEVIKAIADTGGLFGVFMMSFWLTNDKVPTTDHYINHLKHVAKVAGIDAVAIANDYPLRGQKNLLKLNNNNAEGVKQYLDWWHSLREKNVLGYDVEPVHVVIPELNHIDRMERIDLALGKAGFTSNDRDKIMGQNWQRVLNEVLV
ncbi:Twin-arginine translocation pathway signal [Shewanella piezotolerans WP3]|uniref:Twin-arginine translocation pathway signal n=1 Tax=Shewanella piezotolerans (strain WP3 / JCM 13877) TaxID=225849 RepID=B8CU67_SHEPW|nr:membrane dipeptidase [Shewanella piezotolerans]ACJ30923.1 Twin-arginine translocation pathway signal [Shewanella piezotolerans WP3]